jgi:hypothetical protein
MLSETNAYAHDYRHLADTATRHTGRTYDAKSIETELRRNGTINVPGMGAPIHGSSTARAKFDAKKFLSQQGPEVQSARLDPIKKTFTIRYKDGGEPLVFDWKQQEGDRLDYLKTFAAEVKVGLKAIDGVKSESMSLSARKVYQELMHDISQNTMGANDIATKVKTKISGLSKSDQAAIRDEILGD